MIQKKCIILLLTFLILVEIECRRRHYHYHQRYKDHAVNNIANSKHYYVINHYYLHPEDVSKYYKVSTNNAIACEVNIEQILCTPNSYLLCLSNGTLMCISEQSNVVSCGFGIPSGISFMEKCDEDCAPGQENVTVCLPCLANMTLVIEQTFQNQTIITQKEHCIVVIAELRKLHSPTGALLNYLLESGRALAEEVLPLNN